MNRFRHYIKHQRLNEGRVKKAAVAVYANTSKRHGDQAEALFNRARNELQRALKQKSIDKKIDDLNMALQLLIDGLISSRRQIGSVSAQITASSVLEK